MGAGQPVALLRDLHKLDAPQELRSEGAGIVAILRSRPIVAPGDHLCVICPELPSQALEKLVVQASV